MHLHACSVEQLGRPRPPRLLVTRRATWACTPARPSKNESGSRFRIVSILTTATQLAFVSEVCDPAMEGTERAASVAHLLPSGVSADAVGSAELGRDVFAHQVGAFLGRSPNADELDAAATAGDGCQRALCTAEELARVACFSVLSSSELLFY